MVLNEIGKWVVRNTFLALIPVVMAYTIADLVEVTENRRRLSVKGLILILGVVWFAFLPNTCYLLTEWRHFLTRLDYSNLYVRWRMTGDADTAFELMTHTLFYLCYSGIGALTFTLAIRPMARLLKRSGATVWVWAIPFFMLMSLGMYLGLIMRYNSWDLIGRPGDVWRTVADLRLRPTLSAFIVAFGGFLWLVYAAVDIWIDGFVCRWKGMRGADVTATHGE